MSAFDDKMRAALAADSDEEALEIMRGESWQAIADWLNARIFLTHLTTTTEED